MPSSRIFHPDQIQWRPYVYRAADIPEFRRPGTVERSDSRAAAAPAALEPAPVEPPAHVLRLRLDEAYERGRREGELQARDTARAEVGQALDELARGLASLAGFRPRLRREAEADLVHLAVAIARRVIHREITLDPDALRAIAAVALSRLESQEIVRARVCPAQREPLAAALGTIASNARIEICADPALPAGGLVIETTRGNLDASVESQLAEIENGLAERIG